MSDALTRACGENPLTYATESDGCSETVYPRPRVEVGDTKVVIGFLSGEFVVGDAQDAAAETLCQRSPSGFDASLADSGGNYLCFTYWSNADRILREHGRETERVRLRRLRRFQRLRLGVIREDIDQYLSYFWVSTRDPDAPPPGSFALRQALTLLAGMRPEGQCRVCGDP